jgi:uncharacterized protein (DUF433 family)
MRSAHFGFFLTTGWRKCYSSLMAMQTVTMAKADDGSKVIEGVIWIDPERQGGEPCFINTRVPIKILFDYLAGGDPLDEFLEGFPPVTREQAEKVLELAKNNLLSALTSGENSA